MEETPELRAHIAFSCVPGFGFKVYTALLSRFGSLEKAWNVSESDLRVAGLSEKLARGVVETRGRIDIDSVLQIMRDEDMRLVVYGDALYPLLLKEISSPPVCLYYRGEWPKDEWCGLAVVGTRNITSYGKAILPNLIKGIVGSGLVVVSGLAYGVDSFAHEETLDAGGMAIAVLGGGIDSATIYPAANRGLAERIVSSGGLLLSEYPPGTSPQKFHFPARNRIVSGLSLGVLVVEAAARSGTLITAQLALEQGREVLAVPGAITSRMSEGPHYLLKRGAYPVTTVQDIYEVFEFTPKQSVVDGRCDDASSEEVAILALLSSDPIHIDKVVRECHLDSHTVSSALQALEMRGVIKHVGNMCYVRI